MTRRPCATRAFPAILTAPVLLLAVACGGSAAVAGYDHMLAAYGRDRRAAARDPLAVAAPGQVFAGQEHLDRGRLVRAVLARNPGIAAAREAWRAALARVPQDSALDDPMVQYQIAPLSLDGDVRFGQSVTLSQRLPFPGKRGLAGEAALARADAARGDLAAVRLDLATQASKLYDDYVLIERSLAINDQHTRLLEDMKNSATVQYTAGRASQQDPLQAEVELTHIEHARVVLEAQRDVVVAELNGLLHRAPAQPIPPPPVKVAAPAAVPASDRPLEAEALRRRPELAAGQAQIRAGQAATRLAKKQYWPDFELMGSYNSMWAMPEHQWMVGVGINLPLWRDRRRAGVDEAQARTRRAREDLARRDDQIRSQVRQAYLRLEEAHHVVMLYQDRILPATTDQVAAARAGFVSGQNSFLALVEAEKGQRDVELALAQARAELDQRRADLDRAVGRIPGLSDRGGEQ